MRPALPRRGVPRYPARMQSDYSGRDLSGRDLSSANLTVAKLTGAVRPGPGAVRRPGISRADLEGAKGLDTVKGLVD